MAEPSVIDRSNVFNEPSSFTSNPQAASLFAMQPAWVFAALILEELQQQEV